MIGFGKWKIHSVVCIVAAAGLISGCTTSQNTSKLSAGLTSHSGTSKSTSYAYTPKDKECLERAMFFESNRSSKEGLIAVGTVVMNRLDSGKWGNSICGVVGQKNQFAPGVLTRPMRSAALPDVQAAADAVLKGERNPRVKNAMFFHTAGLKFPYKNMHYTVVAGGNAFYEKRDRYHSADIASNDASRAIANAYIASTRMAGGNVQVASAAAPTAATISTPTSGRVVKDTGQQPFLVAQADLPSPPRMAFASDRVAVPIDPPAQAMEYTAPSPVTQPAQAASGNGVLAYEAPTAKKVDAIGQMLLAQDRPN
ncbi:cell wall hydrolase [Phyllobacterium endophyticum]|uniref:cell wall hydrolase n=1 Tax=Phyllobacterium endophyticum TaxID=1149773 RepID=UPI00182B5ED6|nr:cell wall hydrolase [Phyllobacterium endophyticum]MBB3233422.1 spore germination cell wall hydrolase CwlJ-like protein [Phyllobacterium endophyticum]